MGQVKDRGILEDLATKLDDAWRLFDVCAVSYLCNRISLTDCGLLQSTSNIRIEIAQQEILRVQQQHQSDMNTVLKFIEPSTGCARRDSDCGNPSVTTPVSVTRANSRLLEVSGMCVVFI